MSAVALAPRPVFRAWTVDRLAELQKLRAQKKSASVIAAELGTTKGAVVGAVKRARDNGDASFEWSAVKATITADGRQPAPKKAAIALVWTDPVPRCPDLPLFQQAIGVSASRHVSIIDLERDECRWPDERGPGYCGGSTARGESFCPGHRRLAYRPRES